ncbi:hypothetical protein [Catenibacterium sp.]|uniref:hypothetical protein n=1 Tax=Catenibacterium sp. TaxID=2049022 RepID=UPI002E7A891B|nr:hypothetical protein [Catenibacterium sp.]MEE0040899.1 hypothetical protein [Catenibacterium sp.]
MKIVRFYSDTCEPCEVLDIGKFVAKKDKHGVCYLNTYANQRIIVNGSDKDRTDLIGKSIDLKDLIEVVDKVKEEIQTLIKNL